MLYGRRLTNHIVIQTIGTMHFCCVFLLVQLLGNKFETNLKLKLYVSFAQNHVSILVLKVSQDRKSQLKSFFSVHIK